MTAALEEEIKAAARRLGFSLVGITTADPAETAEQYQAWVAEGRAGDMGYMARDPQRRCHPSMVMPGARSIVVVGMLYRSSEREEDSGDPSAGANQLSSDLVRLAMKSLPECGRIPHGEGFHLDIADPTGGILPHCCENRPLLPSEAAVHFPEWVVPRRGMGNSGKRREPSLNPCPTSGSHPSTAHTASPVSAFDSPPPRGRIAHYARGDDYHEVMRERLETLLSWIRERSGMEVRGRAYVDTGPLLERDLARRAGLGWFGKNTNLLHPRLGSYFFLGALLLDLPLQPDPPFAGSHCGTCTRCLDACPTGAFVGPYVLDARRCISYLTIELKGPIPRELRPLIGDWIYGCDICQEVCPWNRKAPATDEPAFRPRAGLAAPELIPLLSMTQEEFSRRFKDSPIKRAKRRGLLRNVAVALGNQGDPAAVPALTGALHDPEPLVRAHAAWALGRLGGAEARAALEAALGTEEDPMVREELALALEAAPPR